jgi:hypothetical protein
MIKKRRISYFLNHIILKNFLDVIIIYGIIYFFYMNVNKLFFIEFYFHQIHKKY